MVLYTSRRETETPQRETRTLRKKRLIEFWTDLTGFQKGLKKSFEKGLTKDRKSGIINKLSRKSGGAVKKKVPKGA